MVRWQRKLGRPLSSSVSMARWTINLKTLPEGWIPPFIIRARSWLAHFVHNLCLPRWGWCQGRKLERVLPLLVETLARARIASGTAQLSVMATSSRIYTGGGWSGSTIWALFSCRWWFKMKCSKSKFTVASVPYTQVVQDPRFKPWNTKYIFETDLFVSLRFVLGKH